LTSFRFLAAFAVVVHHLFGSVAQDPGLAFLGPYCFEGFAGVTFFFVLSGFILTYNYQHRFGALRPRAVWNFWVARAARVYPLHFLGFLAMLPPNFALLRLQPARALKLALPNLTLTHAFVPRGEYYFSFNAVSWSLSDEAFFYLVLPPLLWGLLSFRLAGPRRSALLLLVTWAASLAAVWQFRDHPRAHWLFYVNPLFRLTDFLAGVLLALLFLRLRTARLLRWGRLTGTALELASLGALAAAVHHARALPLPLRFGPYYTLLMALVVFVHAAHAGYVSRLLSCRAGLVLGEVSYAVYLSHVILLTYLRAYGPRFGIGAGTPREMIVVTLAATAAVSLVCHYAYERPLRSLWRRLFTVPEKAPAAAPAAGEVPARLGAAA
jgi:peptidoglycan/LPS O-acetylase OafA/YrhL